LQQACLSLDKMIDGGIYDQVGGGFARYSTDNEWLVPHFEKMLYDNALIVTVLAEAYQLTHHARYADAIDQTIAFIEREMMSPEGGFYSALDADSEGEEGRYYVWTKKEVEALLEDDAELFCKFYDITEKGNWEGKNILHIPASQQPLAETDESGLRHRFENARQKLLTGRAKRIRPLLDDKILLNWNALMNSACCKAYIATGNDHYRQLAVRNMNFLLGSFSTNGEVFFHTCKDGKARFTAFLDDYTFLVQALIGLQEITGDGSYLLRAKKLTEYVLNGFADTASPFFFFTDAQQTDVIVRKKEIYDSAIPSGNSVMAGNLLYLARVFDIKEWAEKAEAMNLSLSALVIRYPMSFGNWANHLLLLVNGMKEIVITGQKINEILFEILHIFMPTRVFQSSSVPNEIFPLLRGKQYFESVLIYECENYVCNLPLTSLSSFTQRFE